MENQTQTPATADAVDVGSGASLGWAHWLWIAPVAVLCSPIGLIITLKFAPAYWPASACAMAVALAGCAYPSRDE